MNFIAKILSGLFTLSFLFSVAQKSKTDSLIAKLKTGISDSLKCHILNDLIEDEMDNAVWPKYNAELKKIAEARIKTNNTGEKLFFLEMLSDAIVNDGYLFQQNGHLKESINEYRKALEIKFDIGDRQGVSNVLSNIGYNYDAAADYKKAANYYAKALKIQEELNDKSGASTTLVNLGSMFLNQHDTLKFGELINRALKYKEQVGDKKGIANCYNSLAIFEERNLNRKKAIEYCFMALKIQGDINYKDGMANTYNNLAGLYTRAQEFDKAKLYADKAFAISKEINDNKGMAIATRRNGDVFRLTNKLQKAKDYCEKSFKYSKLSGEIHEVKMSAEGLYKVYFKMGKKKEADFMLALFTKIKDSTEKKVEIILEDEFDDSLMVERVEPGNSANKNEEIGLSTFLIFTMCVIGLIILIILFLVWKKKNSQ